jgi:hypothetical protein
MLFQAAENFLVEGLRIVRMHVVRGSWNSCRLCVRERSTQHSRDRAKEVDALFAVEQEHRIGEGTRLRGGERLEVAHQQLGLQGLGVLSRIIDSSERLGRYRWAVEGTLAWISRFRHLAVRDEARADIHFALTQVACSVVCLRFLQSGAS